MFKPLMYQKQVMSYKESGASTPTPDHAYSVARDALGLGYSGNVIRVRRASDNAEQDIGLVTGEMDTASLATFCSGTNGFITTVYDQHGSSNASQATASKQPKIYDSSTGVLVDGGKPCAEYVETGDMALNATVSWTLSAQATFLVASVNSASDNFVRLISQGETGKNDAASTGAYIPLIRNNTESVGSYTDDFRAINSITYAQKYLFSSVHNGSLISNGIDDSTPQTYSHSLSATFQEFTIGATTPSTSPVDSLDGKLQECIVYNSDQTANRTAIESNINSFYGIY